MADSYTNVEGEYSRLVDNATRTESHRSMSPYDPVPDDSVCAVCGRELPDIETSDEDGTLPSYAGFCGEQCRHLQTLLDSLRNEVSELKRRQLSRRELATILAALRYFQDEFLQSGHRSPRQVQADTSAAFPEHFATDLPLRHDEVDLLCERLNSAESRP